MPDPPSTPLPHTLGHFISFSEASLNYPFEVHWISNFSLNPNRRRQERETRDEREREREKETRERERERDEREREKEKREKKRLERRGKRRVWASLARLV